MLTLLIFPSSTDIIANASAIANPWLTEFWPLVYISVGIFTFAVMIRWLNGTISGGIGRLFHKPEEVPHTVTLHAKPYNFITKK